jgi:hypothetical protein
MHGKGWQLGDDGRQNDAGKGWKKVQFEYLCGVNHHVFHSAGYFHVRQKILARFDK